MRTGVVVDFLVAVRSEGAFSMREKGRRPLWMREEVQPEMRKSPVAKRVMRERILSLFFMGWNQLPVIGCQLLVLDWRWSADFNALWVL